MSYFASTRVSATAHLLIGACAVLLMAGCAGTSDEPKTADAADEQELPKDDQSRCEFRGRVDREVQETKSPGAEHRNVRRVYGLYGEGEDFRRVLVCREVDTNLDGLKDLVRTYDESGDMLYELADSDYDGNIDTWLTFSHGRVSRRQVDENGDGKPDETRFYVKGTITRAQRDTNHDGRIDIWEIYEDGRLQRMGVDLDQDGHVDRWERDEAALRQLEREEQSKQGQRGADEAP